VRLQPTSSCLTGRDRRGRQFHCRGPRNIAGACSRRHLWGEQHRIGRGTNRNHSRANSKQLASGDDFSRSPVEAHPSGELGGRLCGREHQPAKPAGRRPEHLGLHGVGCCGAAVNVSKRLAVGVAHDSAARDFSRRARVRASVGSWSPERCGLFKLARSALPASDNPYPQPWAAAAQRLTDADVSSPCYLGNSS
jgi:hypothetical protein